MRVTRVKWILAGLFILSGCAVMIFGLSGIAVLNKPDGERKKSWSGRNFAGQTDVQARPTISRVAPGWHSERVWSGQDDWEPVVATDPSSNYVYQMTTRFDPNQSAVVIRSSPDSGANWGTSQFVGPVNEWQADPQVQVANDGTVYVVWLDGPNWRSKLVKSFDHGQTWTTPLDIAPSLIFTDHPWLVISPDGKDVYVGLNENESYFVASHDFGATFAAPIRTSYTRGRWWLHASGAMSTSGDVYYAVIDYPLNYHGASGIYVIRSHDHGVSWQPTLVDTSAASPDCSWASGCYYGFLSSTAAIAIDQSGKIMLIYNGGSAPGEPQQLWVTTSDDGTTWTRRAQLSQRNPAANNGFPSVAAGPIPGDFRVIWQGNRNGNNDGWNTYYRTTKDGGTTWSPIVRLSDRTNGAPYKNHAGYMFPYGDYLGLSVDRAGVNHVIWGEGASYDGPGGTWYTRGQ
jgi:hypothetical protein